MFRYHIFISYRLRDSEDYADTLHARLLRQAYRVWYDKNHIRWMNSLNQSIDEGLDKSYYGIVIFSRNYLESQWTELEFAHIINSGSIFLIFHGTTLDEIRARAESSAKYSNIYSKIRDRHLIFSSTSGLDYILEEVNRNIRDTITRQRSEFTTLRDFLGAQNWKRADQETYDLIKRRGLLNFPHEDLSIINLLWSIYSDMQNGFSVQKRLYQESLVSQDNNYLNAYENFGEKVGWRVAGRPINVCTDKPVTPKGHLPLKVYLTGMKEMSEDSPKPKVLTFLSWIVGFLVTNLVYVLIGCLFVVSIVCIVAFVYSFQRLSIILFLIAFPVTYFILDYLGKKRKRQKAEEIRKFFGSKFFSNPDS